MRWIGADIDNREGAGRGNVMYACHRHVCHSVQHVVRHTCSKTLETFERSTVGSLLARATSQVTLELPVVQ